eukprot:13689537-Ditylum_brightwellii.AAC.1
MHSWRRTGVNPFDPNCEGWSAVLKGLGLVSVFEQDLKKIESLISDFSYEIRVRDDRKNYTLTSKEIAMLKEGYTYDTDHILLIAHHQGHGILAKWRK